MTGGAETVQYRVVVRGELGDQFAVLFPAMRLARDEGTTVLTGPVGDQAQLAGLIERTQDLGLELVSVCPVEPLSSGEADAD
jgi:hypothetical protein